MPNRQSKVVTDFTGGLNTDKTHRHIADNELEIANNVDFTERGGIRKRKPFVTHDSLTDNIEWLFEWRLSNGVTELMAVTSPGDIIKVSDKQTVFNSAFVAAGFDYEILQDYLYILDGNEYYRIDEDTFNTEVVQDKDTSGYESYTEQITVTPGTASDLEFDELQVDSETVKDEFGGETIYTKDTDYTMDYSLGTITPLEEGSIDGGSIVISYEYFVESDVDLSNIRKCKYLIRHNKSNRFFAAGNPSDPSAIYYSEMLEPNNFKGYSVVYPTTNDGPVQGMEILNDMLLVFYKNSVWAWRGIDPQRDAVWEKLPLKHGLYNRHSLEMTQNTLTFVDLDGIYTLDSLKSAQNIAENKVRNIIKGIGNRNDITANFDASESVYYLAYNDSAGTANKLLVSDWGIGAFSIWSGFDISDIEYSLEGELFIASGNKILKQADTGTETINMKVKTKEFVLENPYSDKLITRVYVSLNNYTANTKLRVITDNATKEFDVTTNTQRFDIQERSVVVQIEVEDNSGEDIILYDIGIEYKPIATYRGDKR